MDLKNIAANLHPLEKKIVPHLKKSSNINELMQDSKQDLVQVMRALNWLSNKRILKISEQEFDQITLGKNGIIYKQNGLPEKRFLESIKNSSKKISDILKTSKIHPNEVNICIGTLKKKGAIKTEKVKELIISITESGKKLLTSKTLEEKFLEKKFPITLSNIKPEEKFAMENLRTRKNIVHIEKIKTKSYRLTELGLKLTKVSLSKGVSLEKLSSNILKSSSWKNKKFREYDVEINVPQISGGKKHFVNQAKEYIRNIWLELGFEEMTGEMVQTSFWDLDSLFVPQDHPARNMQDTFYIKEPRIGKLPNFYREIKNVHENGSNTGSTGWKNEWSESIAKENLLRTHTTVLSAQTIANIKESDMPAKFFSIGKVFRNEAMDYKHLFEFYQVEGIVVDPNANFTNLKGYLREFFIKMGYLDVRIRPAHFPYTEPSAEIEVLHPEHKEWIELGGAGIFRPEVTKPLIGTEIPVLAWGLGLGRIISEYWGLKDIRDLYKNNLKQLREMKFFMR